MGEQGYDRDDPIVVRRENFLTSSGEVLSIRSMVVAHEEVTRVWPVGIIVKARLATLYK